MKKLDAAKKHLILGLGLIASLGIATISSSYAWFAVRQMDIQQTEFISGQLGINLVSATAYKWVYPVYQGTTLPNYDSLEAGVQSSNVTSVTDPVDSSGYLVLNKLDTTQIYFDNGASSSITENNLRTAIASQKTSILVEIVFAAVNTEAVGFSLLCKRSNADSFDYTNTTNNLADMNLLASDFLCFTTWLDPTLDASIDTPTEYWEHFRDANETTSYPSSYASRKFFHQDANSHGTDLTVHASNLTKNANTTPVSHTLYLFMEYEPTHISPYFMNVERLRFNYHLANDFHFVLQLSSEVIS